MTYQSFPDKKGASDSEGKLQALHFPPLEGKKFLDLGCNEGFFCQYAKEQGAKLIVGIDQDENFIRIAKERNPDIEFNCQSWDNLSNEKFNVILFSSSLHYVEEPINFFKNLENHLEDDGMIVLECGLSNPNMIYPSGIEHQFRHDGLRVYPTYQTLKKWMKGFSLRWIGNSVDQAGDTIPRFVIHAKKKKTRVILIEGMPSSGKTNLINNFNADVIIHADTLKEFTDCPNIMEYWDNLSDKKHFQNIIEGLIKINKGVDCIVVEGYILKDMEITLPEFLILKIKL